jgi:hypothetical protein
VPSLRTWLATIAPGALLAALVVACPADVPTPCVDETCAEDCREVGFTEGACAGGACLCSGVEQTGDIILPRCERLREDSDADSDGDEDAADADPDGDVEQGDADPTTEPQGQVCANDRFLCTYPPGGARRCEGQTPALGGAPGWACEVQPLGVIRCSGAEAPRSTAGFDCEQGESGPWVCIRHVYTPAELGADEWACSYERDVYLVCEVSSEPPDPPEACCVPYARRYCGTSAYCRWGEQVCAEDGERWGPCDEQRAIPGTCAQFDAWYSREGEVCCIAIGACCQDLWDSDDDGDTWESVGACDDVVREC